MLEDVIVKAMLLVFLQQVCRTLSRPQSVRYIVARLLQGTAVDIKSHIVLLTHFAHLGDGTQIELLHTRMHLQQSAADHHSQQQYAYAVT